MATHRYCCHWREDKVFILYFIIEQIEAIGVFIDGCKKYGMSEKDLFVSLDLHEEQNKTMVNQFLYHSILPILPFTHPLNSLPLPLQVIATLFSLGRQAQKKGYEGPAFGPKEAEANQREFSEAQIREGRNTIGLQMGTNQVANQKGMTPYGHARQIADVRTV